MYPLNRLSTSEGLAQGNLLVFLWFVVYLADMYNISDSLACTRHPSTTNMQDSSKPSRRLSFHPVYTLSRVNFRRGHLIINVNRIFSHKHDPGFNYVISVLQNLSDAVVTIGPIKLNIGQLCVLSKRTDALLDLKYIVQISLRPAMEQSERKSSINSSLHDTSIISKYPTKFDIIISTVCINHYNTAFDITALVESLKHFGATDLRGLTKIGGPSM
ncbi:hypothetical protein M422DRAFT_53183 [Sphaerobolus stellatus SS14]|uniref:Unplaced genomic scaffold SPHSTscaffold_161, whole genome shotgun sequence n=1 Tax=Sphaerobolus stellatus (strain SS14) TaxID=990650 RepID=A0A0C9UB61_SPHS4|nr:hypothetical protein M422DRAFT_53183 [Sphaerobolus stellatus SS14]